MKTIQVIHAGLPRPSTTLFTKVLKKLLGGPLYHGGFVGEIIRDLLAGYTAIVDVPASYYLEELVRVLFFSPRTGESFDMLVVA